MAVTKQIYSLTVGFSPNDVIDQLGQAFIDAGLMVGWHDQFTIGNSRFAVYECVYDGAKQFGTTYYVFWVSPSRAGCFVGTNGWDTVAHTFTGTQYLDYALQPSDAYGQSLDYGGGATSLTSPMTFSNATTLDIFRYTSTADKGSGRWELCADLGVLRSGARTDIRPLIPANPSSPQSDTYGR